MLDSYFTWNGVSSAAYGLVISKEPDMNRPKRKYEKYDIAGQNGNALDVYDAFENVVQVYKVKFGKGFDDASTIHETARAISEWLYGPRELCILSDSYETDVYREAWFTGPLDIKNQLEKYGVCEIRFTCKPQRYLSGEYSGGSPLVNPTGMTAHPLIVLTCRDSVRPSLLKWWGRTSGSYNATYYDESIYYVSSGATATLTKSGGIAISAGGSVRLGMPVRPNTKYGYRFQLSSGICTFYFWNERGALMNSIIPSVAGGLAQGLVTTPAGAVWVVVEFAASTGDELTAQEIQFATSDIIPDSYVPADTNYLITAVFKDHASGVTKNEIVLKNPVGTVYIDTERKEVSNETGYPEEVYSITGGWPEIGTDPVDLQWQGGHVQTARIIPRWWTL